MNDVVLAWAGAVLGFAGTVWVLSLFVELLCSAVFWIADELRMLRK